jgi:hypothetical protein
MTRLAGLDHASIVVVAWDDQSLAEGLAVLTRPANRSQRPQSDVVVDMRGFRPRLTSHTFEAILRAHRLLDGRLLLRGANPAHARLLATAGIRISAAEPAPRHQLADRA